MNRPFVIPVLENEGHENEVDMILELSSCEQSVFMDNRGQDTTVSGPSTSKRR